MCDEKSTDLIAEIHVEIHAPVQIEAHDARSNGAARQHGVCP